MSYKAIAALVSALLVVALATPVGDSLAEKASIMKMVTADSAKAAVSRATAIDNARSHCNKHLERRSIDGQCYFDQEYIDGPYRVVDFWYYYSYYDYCYMRVYVRNSDGGVSSSKIFKCGSDPHWVISMFRGPMV